MEDAIKNILFAKHFARFLKKRDDKISAAFAHYSGSKMLRLMRYIDA
jgi:hypothetical protein